MGDHPLKKMHHFMEFSWIKNLNHLHFKLDSYFPKSFVSAQTKRLWFKDNCQIVVFLPTSVWFEATQLILVFCKLLQLAVPLCRSQAKHVASSVLRQNSSFGFLLFLFWGYILFWNNHKYFIICVSSTKRITESSYIYSRRCWMKQSAN